MSGSQPVAKRAFRTTHPNTPSASVTLNPQRDAVTIGKSKQADRLQSTWAMVCSAIGFDGSEVAQERVGVDAVELLHRGHAQGTAR